MSLNLLLGRRPWRFLVSSGVGGGELIGLASLVAHPLLLAGQVLGHVVNGGLPQTAPLHTLPTLWKGVHYGGVK